MPGTRFQSFVMLALVLGIAACTPGGDESELEAVERLNTEEGTLARFTFPYYTSILARPGGGAIAVWMRSEPPFRPMVYRRAIDGTSAFGEEEYLGTGHGPENDFGRAVRDPGASRGASVRNVASARSDER